MSNEYESSTGNRGAIAPVAPGKTRITIRQNDDVLSWFRAQVHAAGGGNCQSLINLALREPVRRSAEPLEMILRSVLHEGLRREPGRRNKARRAASTSRAAAGTKAGNRQLMRGVTVRALPADAAAISS